MSETSNTAATGPIANASTPLPSPLDPVVSSLIQAGVESATDALSAKLAELEAGQSAHADLLRNVAGTVSSVVDTVANHASQIDAVAGAISDQRAAVMGLSAMVSQMLPHVLSWISVRVLHFWSHTTDPGVSLDTQNGANPPAPKA